MPAAPASTGTRPASTAVTGGPGSRTAIGEHDGAALPPGAAFPGGEVAGVCFRPSREFLHGGAMVRDDVRAGP